MALGEESVLQRKFAERRGGRSHVLVNLAIGLVVIGGVVGLLLLSGTASVATLWETMPPWTQPAFGLVVAAVTIWSVLGRYAAKAAAAHTICQQCNELAVEWRTLLADLDRNRIDDMEARKALDSLDHRMSHATARSGDVGLSMNDKINERSAKEAAEELELSYA